MNTTKVKCETCVINARFSDGKKASLTVPSHTRNEDDFNVTLEGLRRQYIKESKTNELSMADFAFWLLTFAATEPFEQ